MQMTRQCGFTVVELMVTLSIVAILVSAAAPGYQDWVATTRLNSHANELVTALHFARSEAVKRNASVSLCKSSDSATCATTGTWAQGWIVFADLGTVGTFDAGTDTVLRTHDKLTGGTTLVGQTAVASVITFRANGSAAQGGTIDMCSYRQTVAGRDIVITAGTGKPVAVVDAASTACNGA
jgi:type IV fimbrial biogenesis protein FimT